MLISLFQLNTPEFSMLLAALPKTFQDGATKLLQNHLKNTGNVAQVRLTTHNLFFLFFFPALSHHRNMHSFHSASSGSDGQPSHSPHPPISSQLVQPGHLSHQHLPQHPLTKVTHTNTHKAPLINLSPLGNFAVTIKPEIYLLFWGEFVMVFVLWF